MKLYFNILTSNILLILLFISFPKVIFAGVMINEIYPNPKDAEKEWIEVINTDSEPVNLSGWYFEDKAANIKKIESISSINKDEIKIIEGDVNSSGDGDGWFLNNTDEKIYLKDAGKNIIDEYSYSKTNEGWSFARIPDGKIWYETISVTKGESNGNTIPTPTSVSTPTSTPKPTTTTTPTSTSTPTPQPNNDYENISLTEIYPSPESGSNEWVEIYNGNDSEVNLDGWYIQDNAGTYKELNDFTIGGKSYAYFAFGSGYLNNVGDTVTLTNTEKKTKSSLPGAYPDLDSNQSWAKVGDGWCIAKPSKGEANNTCFNQEDESSPTPVPSSKLSATATPKSTAKVKTTPELEATDSANDLRQLPVLGVATNKETPEASIASDPTKQTSKLLLPIGIAGSGLMLLGGSLTALNKPELITGIIKTLLHR